MSVYISIAQAVELTGLSPKTIRRRIADGTLPASRVAGTRSIRIRRADLERLMQPVREA